MSTKPPNFDWIARPYRLLERLSMGRSLERMRFAFADGLGDARTALVLGDGDGRFTERLLTVNPTVHVTSVDSSEVMLRLARERCRQNSYRLRTVREDALTFCRSDLQSYDLVATHFFLDCLTQQQADELARHVAPRVEPGGHWVLSEFAIPHGRLRILAQTLVRGLYGCFRLATGLRVSRLPDHTCALADAGFIRLERQHGLAGILCAERWRLRERTPAIPKQ